MGNVLRLTGGGQIQVRTGVLQGIGPAGPRGLIGPQGPDGTQGPEGPAGPMGQILQMQTKTIIGGVTNIAAAGTSLLAFGSVAYDDMGICASSTNFIFPVVADYLFNATIVFPMTGSSNGVRGVRLVSNINGEVGQGRYPVVANQTMVISLSCPFRTTAENEMVQVFVDSTDNAATVVSAGYAVIARIGSGPQGPVGPQGPQGPIGAQGPAGPQGPAGNANSGFTTYADLL
jgi:hypothetical protein